MIQILLSIFMRELCHFNCWNWCWKLNPCFQLQSKPDLKEGQICYKRCLNSKEIKFQNSLKVSKNAKLDSSLKISTTKIIRYSPPISTFYGLSKWRDARTKYQISLFSFCILKCQFSNWNHFFQTVVWDDPSYQIRRCLWIPKIEELYHLYVMSYSIPSQQQTAVKTLLKLQLKSHILTISTLLVCMTIL